MEENSESLQFWVSLKTYSSFSIFITNDSRRRKGEIHLISTATKPKKA